MEFWEFLIQKEGDRSWLPLESPRVEILEGRYRVMARSSRVNTAVEICIAHETAIEHPPKRRIQKRTSRTNPDGLIVVIPFTRLLPGMWELRCMGDLMSDMMGQSWQYIVRLQVVAHETATDGDWEPDWDEEGAEPEIHRPDPASAPASQPGVNSTAPVASPSVTAPGYRGRAVTEGVESGQPDLNGADHRRPDAIPGPEAEPPAPSEVESAILATSEAQPNSKSDADWAELVGLAWQLTLTRDAHAIQGSHTLLLEGQIELEAGGADVLPPTVEVELQVILRHPQTAQLVLDSCYPASLATLPCPIQLPVSLPQAIDTRLLLGELRLIFPRGADPVLLAAQSFTVVTAVEELLDAIARPDPDSTLYAPLEFLKSGDATLNLAFLDLLDAPRPMMQFQTVEKEVLPPQLHPPDAGRSRARPLDLPFSSSQSILGISPLFDSAVQQAIAASQAASLQSNLAPEHPSDSPTADLPADVTLECQEDGAEAVPAPGEDAGRSAEPDAPGGELSPEPVLESTAGAAEPVTPPQLEPIADPASPWMAEAIAELSVNPTEMDLPPPPDPTLVETVRGEPSPFTLPELKPTTSPPLRLQPGLTPESEAFQALNLRQRFWQRLTTIAAQSPSPSSPDRPTSSSGNTSVPPITLTPDETWLELDLASQEFVVDDDFPLAAPVEPLKQVPAPDRVPVLSPDEAVPVPHLDIPPGELTAGRAVKIVAALPPVEPRIYVKLWVHDCQTRSLLDGPKWLVNFMPNAANQLEAWISVTVPYGCLTVQFEAIAVEMATQRESSKVSISRNVVPPDLPLPSVNFHSDLDL